MNFDAVKTSRALKRRSKAAITKFLYRMISFLMGHRTRNITRASSTALLRRGERRL